MKTFYFNLISLLLITVTGCNSISSDPIEGAGQLKKELSQFAKSDNLQELNITLSKYWDKYPEENRTTFLLAFRREIIANDTIVGILANSDAKIYPMCEIYLKSILDIEYNIALSNLGEIAKSNDKNSFISSPSAHAILLCSLLANHAEKKDKNEAYKDIETAYNNLKSSPLLFKMEFFNSYIRYIRESGELGIKVYYFMQELDSPIYYNFVKLAFKYTPNWLTK